MYDHTDYMRAKIVSVPKDRVLSALDCRDSIHVTALVACLRVLGKIPCVGPKSMGEEPYGRPDHYVSARFNVGLSKKDHPCRFPNLRYPTRERLRLWDACTARTEKIAKEESRCTVHAATGHLMPGHCEHILNQLKGWVVPSEVCSILAILELQEEQGPKRPKRGW